ncbi:hypothetical protein CRG98_040779, partial [Punica granatum]
IRIIGELEGRKLTLLGFGVLIVFEHFIDAQDPLEVLFRGTSAFELLNLQIEVVTDTPLLQSWNQLLFFFRKFILPVNFIFHLNIPSGNSMCTWWSNTRQGQSLNNLGQFIKPYRKFFLPLLESKELAWLSHSLVLRLHVFFLFCLVVPLGSCVFNLHFFIFYHNINNLTFLVQEEGQFPEDNLKAQTIVAHTLMARICPSKVVSCASKCLLIPPELSRAWVTRSSRAMNSSRVCWKVYDPHVILAASNVAAHFTEAFDPLESILFLISPPCQKRPEVSSHCIRTGQWKRTLISTDWYACASLFISLANSSGFGGDTSLKACGDTGAAVGIGGIGGLGWIGWPATVDFQWLMAKLASPGRSPIVAPFFLYTVGLTGRARKRYLLQNLTATLPFLVGG